VLLEVKAVHLQFLVLALLVAAAGVQTHQMLREQTAALAVAV
jgi:hypothetical protein